MKPNGIGSKVYLGAIISVLSITSATFIISAMFIAVLGIRPKAYMFSLELLLVAVLSAILLDCYCKPKMAEQVDQVKKMEYQVKVVEFSLKILAVLALGSSLIFLINIAVSPRGNPNLVGFTAVAGTVVFVAAMTFFLIPMMCRLKGEIEEAKNL